MSDFDFLAKKFKSKFEISILSGDKDFTQLVDEKVNIIDTMKGKTISTKQVIEKYGLKPDQMIDFFSLVGDSVDNIPGVKGIGPKTAQDLLSKYKTLGSIYKNLNKIDK